MACTHYQNKPLLISVGYARSCVISFHKHSLMHHQNRSLRCCCACCVCLCVLNYTCASVFTCAEWNIPTFLAHWLQKKEKISTNSSHKSFGLRLIFCINHESNTQPNNCQYTPHNLDILCESKICLQPHGSVVIIFTHDFVWTRDVRWIWNQHANARNISKKPVSWNEEKRYF